MKKSVILTIISLILIGSLMFTACSSSANNEIRFPLNIIYSLIVTFIVTSAGVFAFRKKDLK